MEAIQVAALALRAQVNQGIALTGVTEVQLFQIAVAAVVALGFLYLIKDVINTLLIPSINVELTDGKHTGGVHVTLCNEALLKGLCATQLRQTTLSMLRSTALDSPSTKMWCPAMIPAICSCLGTCPPCQLRR